MTEHGTFPVAPDLIEALAATGRAEQARAVIARLREAGEHPWTQATVARGEGVLELDAARLEDAHAAYERLGMPFDAARTLLAHAELARRQRRWAQARTRLEAAAEAFDALGSPGWAERARADLALVAPRPRRRKPDELTAAERRVAELAAPGATNREIAAALAISVHTVEVHLSRAYLKLGVRSRPGSYSGTSLPSSGTTTRSGQALGVQPRAQVHARLGGVRDGVEMDGHDADVGRVARQRDDVVVAHHDRIAGGEARGAGVDDDRSGTVCGERVAHVVAEDRVAGDVELRVGVQNEPGDRRHLLADLARAVAAAGAGDRAALRRSTSSSTGRTSSKLGGQRLDVLGLA